MKTRRVNMGQQCLVWIALCVEGIACVPSVRTVFYLHTTPRTWNEAKLICEAETAELFRVRSEHVIDELLYVDSISEWRGNFTKLLSERPLWLALYETKDVTAPYLYHGCGTPNTYVNWSPTGQPNTADKEFCVAMDSSYSWRSIFCNESYHFICQRTDGDCWFDPKENTLGTASTLIVDDVIVADEAECASSCRNGWINNTECWAFSYRKSDRTCRQHYHTQPTTFLQSTSGVTVDNTDWTFFSKICVGGLLRSVETSYTNEDIQPHVVNCSGQAPHDPSWDESVCFCECRDPPALWEPIISSLSLEQKIELIVAQLAIDTKNTSAAHRKLTSAKDVRPSAQSIGYIGIVFLVVVFGSVVILDVNVLVMHTHSLVKKLKEKRTDESTI